MKYTKTIKQDSRKKLFFSFIFEEFEALKSFFIHLLSRMYKICVLK